MYYALNLWDFEGGKIDTYREFVSQSEQILNGLGGSALRREAPKDHVWAYCEQANPLEEE
jgi:hypothetical protein